MQSLNNGSGLSMTKGRKPDPTRERRGTGNHPKPGQARKTNVPVIAVSTELSIVDEYPPPDSLPALVHDTWRAVVRDLGGSNHMRDSYVPALSAYCEALYVHAEASANIHKFGVLVKGPNGAPIPNPMIKVQKDASATLLRYAEALGLTPSGRIRLGLMEVTGMSLLASLNSGIDNR